MSLHGVSNDRRRRDSSSEVTSQFHAPTEFSELIELMTEPGTNLIAGGTSLVPLLKQGFVDPSRLVWVGRVRAMNGVRLTAEGLSIGGATPIKAIADSELVWSVAPAVAKAAHSVGNSRVRSVATIGGAIAHADPRQDLPPALLATDARVVVANSASTKEAHLRDGFFAGFMATVLQPPDVIREVVIPRTDSLEDYVRFTPSSPDQYPTMSIAARFQPNAAQPVITIGLGGLAATPLYLEQPSFDPSVGDSMRRFVDQVRTSVDPVDDELGSADYKSWVAGVWAERVVGRLLASRSRADS